MKKTSIAEAVTLVSRPGQKTTEQLLAEAPISWESLSELRDSLNPKVSEFMEHAMALTSNKEIIDNLGELKPMFDKFIAIFLADMTKFATNIERITKMHADKTGNVITEAEYIEHSSISFEYEAAYMNIVTIVAPLMVQLMEIVATSQRARQPAPDPTIAAAAAADVNVITDVVPKTVH